jgi:hypothetical protein
MAGVIPAERIERAIFLLRGEKVMLDRSLAALYGVSVGALNQAVKRNRDRFPEDFMFQLTWEEAEQIRSDTLVLPGSSPSRSQSVILKRGGNVKFRPHAFTEWVLRCFRAS